jgi:hypothetical protein
MARDRHGSGSDRLRTAALYGAARRHARWGGLTEAQNAAGAAELRQIAGNRPDLLAETAGLALGASEDKGREYQLQGEAVAELCRLAGTVASGTRSPRQRDGGVRGRGEQLPAR